MTAHVGFNLSRIVVVESLESHEIRTGAKIAALMKDFELENGVGLSVEYVECEDVVAFKRFVKDLTLDVKTNGRIPLLHVECHGDRSTGLEFANGSQLSWPDLSNLLVTLNEATKFNLVAVFSACYGAYFMSQLGCIEPAPCYAMIAPSEAIYPDEILSGFRSFYSKLFSTTNAGLGVEAMMRLQLQQGAWFAQRAETWFEEVVTGYVENHCTKSEAKHRALRMQRQLRSDGVDADLGKLRRDLVQLNRSALVGEYFERYFMTDAVHETLKRFQPVRQRIEQRLAVLRKTGRYAV